jgi:hypothetical protein
MTQISSATVESPAATPTGSAASGSSPDAPLAEAFAALLAGVPVPTDAAVAAVPVAGTDAAEPEPLRGRVLSDPILPTQARTPILTATRPIGVPADATALPLRPPTEGAAAVPATGSSPSMPIGLGAAGAEGQGADGAAATSSPAVPRAVRLAEVLQASARPAGPAASAEPAATPPPATVAGAARSQTADAGVPAPAATPAAAPALPLAPPAAPHASAPADAAPRVRAVALEHAVETVRLALRHGTERGVSHARITLAPRELGTVEVHLRHTPDGLVARVVAEHASAVQQLQHAGAELRRSLEQQGLTVLRLDVGGFAGESAGRRGAATAFGHDDRGRPRDGTPVDPLAPLGAADPVAGETTTTLQLPNGALVDVLA